MRSPRARSSLVRFQAAAVLALVAGAACASGRTPYGPGHSKIGFIFVGARDDLGYNQVAWEGSEGVAEAFPDMKILQRDNVPETPAAEADLESMVRQGATVLFATSFGHLKYAEAVARRHPDVVVLHQGGNKPSPPLPNLGTYWGTVYEPVFQAGIAAGAATRSNKLGFVAAFPIPAMYANVNAFTLGARSVNPQATTFLRFTSNWCDPTKQKDAAASLIGLGVDVLTQHQDCTRTILQAAESAGIWSVGYHADGSQVAPKGWLVGSVWNWQPLYVAIVKTILAGKFSSSPYSGDYRGSYRGGDNPFVLTEFGPAVSAATRKAILDAGNRFTAGGSPFAGPLSDRDANVQVPAGTSPSISQADRMNFFVPGVVGEVPKPR